LIASFAVIIDPDSTAKCISSLLVWQN